MIKKTKSGYVVVSHTTGKKLGGPYGTKTQAKRRLAQIQYFKYAKNV